MQNSLKRLERIGKFVSIAGLIGALVACGQPSGSEYVGSWSAVPDEKSVMVIDRNDNGSFIVRTKLRSLLGGEVPVNLPATMKDGAGLQVQGAGGTSK